MKRIAVFFFLILAALSVVKPVYARENIFTTTRIVDFASTAIKYGEDFGFHLYDYIVPSFEKVNENAYVDYEPYAQTMAKFGSRNEPGAARQDNLIRDWVSEIFNTSLYGAILKASDPYGDNVTSDDCFISHGNQKSSPVPFLNTLLQSAMFTNSMRGLYSYPIENGVYNFDRYTTVLAGMNGGEDCKRQDPGDDWEPVGNDQVKLSTFGDGSEGQVGIVAQMRQTIFEIVTKIITLRDGTKETRTSKDYKRDDARQEVILTKDTHQPHSPVLCHLGSQVCNGAYMDKDTEGLDKTGGVFSGFIAANEQRVVQDNAMTHDSVSLLGFPIGKFDNPQMNAKMAFTGAGEGSCTVVPAGLQDDAVIGEGRAKNAVKIKPWCRTEPPAKCPIDVVLDQNPSVKDNSCSLNAGGYPRDSRVLTAIEQKAFPGGMPPNLVKVLKFVGGLYSVPPSLLLATMLEEGSFKHAPTWQWTDDTVRKYSDCTNSMPMPSCTTFINDNNAIGPMGLFQPQIDGATGENDPYAILKDDPLFKESLANRPKGTFSACNFLDAAIYAAWDIGKSHSIYQSSFDPIAPTQCVINGTTYPTYTGTTFAGSCSAWDVPRAQLARLQYSDRICASEGSGIERTNYTFSTYK